MAVKIYMDGEHLVINDITNSSVYEIDRQYIFVSVDQTDADFYRIFDTRKLKPVFEGSLTSLDFQDFDGNSYTSTTFEDFYRALKKNDLSELATEITLGAIRQQTDLLTFLGDELKVKASVEASTDPLILTETYRQRVSELYSLLDFKQINDNLPLYYDIVTSGTATNVWNKSNAWSEISTTNSGDYCVVQSKQRGNYQSGKPAEVLHTFANFDTVSGQEIRIGYFSSSTTAPYNTTYDGFFLSSIDGVVKFEIWKSGTLTDSKLQSEWIDPLDGTGASGITVDWNKLQIMRDTFLWLGVDGITFYLKIGGQLIKLYQFTFENTADFVYMSSPNQPLRIEVRQTGATPITFNYICAAFGSEGSINVTGKNGGIDDDGTSLSASSTSDWYYAIGLKLKTANIGTLVDIVKGSLLCQTNDNFIYRLVLNPTYNGTVTHTDIADYSLSYGLGDNTNIITDFGHILASDLGVQESRASIATDNAIRLGSKIDGTLDEIAIIVKPLSINAQIHRSINFREAN